MKIWKKIIVSSLRITLSAGLLWFALSRIDFYGKTGFFTIIKRINLPWFIPFFTLLGFVILVVAWRWRGLLAAQEIRLSYGQVFRLTYLGHFFNLFMLGTLGGDLIKAVFLTASLKKNNQPDLKTKAIISIVFDRFTGMVSLGILSLGGIIASYHEQKLIWFRILIIGFWVILFAVYLSYRLMKKLTVKLHLPFPDFFNELSEAINTYHDKKKVILKAVGLSLIIQLGVIVINIAFARSIGIEGVPWYYYFIFVPLVSFLTALPISVGGWGVGEVSYGYFFALIGVDPTYAITLSILFRLSFTLWNLPGGLFLLFSKK